VVRAHVPSAGEKLPVLEQSRLRLRLGAAGLVQLAATVAVFDFSKLKTTILAGKLSKTSSRPRLVLVEVGKHDHNSLFVGGIRTVAS